jgi:glycosyltransferase involved in cell wall biosynthesis
VPRILLAADFPVENLPGFESTHATHHATWLPPLAEALTHHPEFDLHWLTFTKRISKPQEIQHLGQTFHLLPRNRLSVQILTRFRSERKQIARLAARLAPDILHAWGTEQGYALAASDHPNPTLVSIQGILNEICKTPSPHPLLRLQAKSEATALRKLTQLTTESPWAAEKLSHLAPQAKIHLLEYGVSPATFAITRNLSPKPLALYVGTLSAAKGVDSLLRAFSHNDLAHIDLALLGTGPLQDSVSRPNISFLGHLPHSQVLDWMSRAWCLVHPTLADSSPNSVKEARVIGLPVVTTPCGGQTQYVTHQQSGHIHPPGDIQGLIQGILSVTKSQQTSLKIGAVGQEICREHLQPSFTANSLTQIYRALRPL